MDMERRQRFGATGDLPCQSYLSTMLGTTGSSKIYIVPCISSVFQKGFFQNVGHDPLVGH